MAINFPKPGLGSISAALTNTLKLPGVTIDPYNNFVRGLYINASRIDTLSMSFSSFRKPLENSLDQVVLPSIKMNFEMQGRPRWEPLKKQTIQNRLYTGYPRGPILQRSRRLKRGATTKNNWEITNNTLRLRTVYLDQKVPYAKFHQLGARTREPGRMIRSLESQFGRGGFKPLETQYRRDFTRSFELPPRPFIKLTLDEEVEIYNIFMSFMVDKVNKHWGRT